MDESDLNDQQAEMLDGIVYWWEHQYKQTYEASGPAGSGKTTIVELAAKRMKLEAHQVLYMAYVGKAAMMLTLKGNIAKTMHSSLYTMVNKIKLDENGKPVLKNGRNVTYRAFERKKFLDPAIKLLVVDEGSMINELHRADILSFGLPVIVLGDLNQLPPVFGRAAFLINPDYVLTKIMRQAEGDPIIKLSQMAIRGEDIPVGVYGDKCIVMPKEVMNDSHMTEADIIICGLNSTRQNINDHYRRNILGIPNDSSLQFGEKLICRQNNWGETLVEGISLVNGLIGYVDRINLETHTKRSVEIDFRPEFPTSEIFSDIPLDYKYLFTDIAEAANAKMSNYNKFQFAYAITAHLAQGSQYENVLIYDERSPASTQSYYNKWLYTSITRAVSGLKIAKTFKKTDRKKVSIFDMVA